jgi:hypothetical protein
MFPPTISNLNIPRVESIPIDLRVIFCAAGLDLNGRVVWHGARSRGATQFALTFAGSRPRLPRFAEWRVSRPVGHFRDRADADVVDRRRASH